MLRRLHARVRKATGKTAHAIGQLGEDGPPKPVYFFPAAVRLEIEETDEGSFLYRYAADDSLCGDTWHEDLPSAMKQAEFEYNVPPDGWKAEQTGPA